MPGHSRPAPITRLLSLFFYLLYQPLAWSYDFVAWLVSLGRWRSWIATALPELSGPRVLELGHGPGHLQRELAESGVASFGIDRSAQMGKLAASRLNAHKLTLAKATALPFQSSSFDQVVATFPTEYILKKETLSEIKRTLKSNGKLVILPVAWIRGRGLLERLAAALFRITGQAEDWDGSFSDAIRSRGFKVTDRRIALQGSEVMLLVCEAAP